MIAKVNNLPNATKNYKDIVARLIDAELWFWGAWDSEDKAMEVAKEIDGLVVLND